jgi:hypothetical protein
MDQYDIFYQVQNFLILDLSKIVMTYMTQYIECNVHYDLSDIADILKYNYKPRHFYYTTFSNMNVPVKFAIIQVTSLAEYMQKTMMSVSAIRFDKFYYDLQNNTIQLTGLAHHAMFICADRDELVMLGQDIIENINMLPMTNEGRRICLEKIRNCIFKQLYEIHFDDKIIYGTLTDYISCLNQFCKKPR